MDDERTRDEDQPQDTGDDQRDAGKSDTGEPAAPSIGAKTEIEHIPPEERLEGKEQSTEDAMGLDKRRGVIGEAYGPSRSRVILTFVAFLAIVGIVFVGLLVLVNQVDQPPETNEDVAVWSAEDAEQQPPQPIDERQPIGGEGQAAAP